MTLDDLAAFGANVDEGMARCMNDEGVYLSLIESVRNDRGFDALQDAIAANDPDAAFEAAHALKGVLGNLSITPLYEPMCELTELLRGRKEADYATLLSEIAAKREEFMAL